MSQETDGNKKNSKQSTCWKCGLVCKNKQGLSVHQNKCLSNVAKGASFFSAARQDPNYQPTKAQADNTEKILPESQTTPDEARQQEQVEQQVENPDSESEGERTSVPIEHPSDSVRKSIMAAYEVIVKWRKNLFELPKGASGKSFVTAITSLIDAWNNKTDKRDHALYAVAIMPNLLLQKTNNKARGKENKETLTRRLEMWNSGKITELLREGEALQRRLPKPNGQKNSMAEKAKR